MTDNDDTADLVTISKEEWQSLKAEHSELKAELLERKAEYEAKKAKTRALSMLIEGCKKMSATDEGKEQLKKASTPETRQVFKTYGIELD